MSLTPEKPEDLDLSADDEQRLQEMARVMLDKREEPRPNRSGATDFYLELEERVRREYTEDRPTKDRIYQLASRLGELLVFVSERTKSGLTFDSRYDARFNGVMFWARGKDNQIYRCTVSDVAIKEIAGGQSVSESEALFTKNRGLFESRARVLILTGHAFQVPGDDFKRVEIRSRVAGKS